MMTSPFGPGPMSPKPSFIGSLAFWDTILVVGAAIAIRFRDWQNGLGILVCIAGIVAFLVGSSEAIEILKKRYRSGNDMNRELGLWYPILILSLYSLGPALFYVDMRQPWTFVPCVLCIVVVGFSGIQTFIEIMRRSRSDISDDPAD